MRTTLSEASPVSIRSPRRSGGRHILRQHGEPARPFQSAPPAEAGGDSPVATQSSVQPSCFNPLPPPKRGETSI